ncbi:class A beta-lactamase-related serine hydrolase [Rheinheimera sediminis]|uniref:serine hydrolase domain-containing protein n=1 Tax=Rheinheimera sp. YQF-1 TaxID=2499626 RepID=UPI000FDC2040|nr:serine hydrolase domain-containing protein [Rheinheimera sp. YQF-1]RVT45570.1 class A beta-lactamase-related serine hydrolase [Rheinheimera sp. YQF-1]
MEASITPDHFGADEVKFIHGTLAKFPTNSQLAMVRIVDNQPQFYGAIKNNTQVEYIDNRYAVFDIGSIAKTFTSAILAQQVVERKLSLNDEVSEILGFQFNNNTKITLKQLANHTSGLSRIPSDLFWELFFKNKDNPYANYDQSRLKEYLQQKLKIKNQDKFSYSNLGAGLLGFVLSEVNKVSYESMLQKAICEPLGLKQITTSRENAGSNLVQGLNTKGIPVPHWDLGALLGAGGIYSSIFDLAKYIIHNINDTNSGFELQREKTATVNKQMGIGLGWFIAKKQNSDNTIYFHDGGTNGFTSIVFMNIQTRSGIAILSNISANHVLKRGCLPQLAQKLYRR